MNIDRERVMRKNNHYGEEKLERKKRRFIKNFMRVMIILVELVILIFLVNIAIRL